MLVVPQRPAGSEQLAEVAAAGLGDGRAVLLAGHGVLAVGADPDAAMVVARVVERQAHLRFLLSAPALDAFPLAGLAER